MHYRVEQRTVFVTGRLDDTDLLRLTSIPEISGLAFESALDARTLRLIDRLLSTRQIPITIYPDHPDLITNLDFMELLPHAQRVEIGFCNLTDVSGLRKHPGLRSLRLGAVHKKRDLDFLECHRDLEELHLEGSFVKQEGIRCASKLKTLVLRSMAVELDAFLPWLPEIACLRLHLGSLAGTPHVDDAKSLELMELWGVRGAIDLSWIAKAKTLKYLELQDLSKVTDLAWTKDLPNLLGVKLENLRNLKTLEGLVDSESLRQLMIIAMTLPAVEIRKIARCKNLKQVSIPPRWKGSGIGLKERMPECDFASWAPWRCPDI